MSIRVILFEPQKIVRIGLRWLFDSAEFAAFDITLVAEYTSPESMAMFYAQNRPDMLITEIHFPNTPVTGLDAMEKLKQEMPESRVIIFTGENNPSFLARASVLGADDYVDKNGNTDELLSAILRIHAGEERQPQHRLNQISAAMKKKRTHQESGIPLTDREIQVLRHIAFGMSNREIARSLKISDETIKEHVQNILRKIGLRDRTQAAVWAVRKKVI